jgi:hypothetical protein
MSIRRSLYDALQADGLLEYGSHISGELVRRIVGLEMPELGRKEDFDAVALAELSAIDQVREILLGEGKYIIGTRDGYRILLPSENRDQIDRYLGHAQNKIRRARKLERCSPPMTNGKPDQTSARLSMIEQAFKKRGARRDGEEGSEA